jgi:D-xylose transport system permease protein
MTDVPATVPPRAGEQKRPSTRELVAATEIDVRLFGMVVALVAIVVGFGALTNGQYLRPDNLITLSVQAAGVAVMATGMVLIIVTRNIDLSVGSIVGVVAMSYALLMTQILPNPPFSLALGSPFMWIIALVCGLVIGATIGGIQGFIIAYIGVPSFVVTLGGLLIFRGLTWVLSSGASVAGLDPTFQLLGGGPLGSIGGTLSWAVGIAISIGIVGLLVYNRRRRHKFGFVLRPMWAEVLLGVVGIFVTMGLVLIANTNLWPPGLANRYAEENGVAVPPGGLQIPVGIPWPLVIVLIVTLVMTFVATRRRFGRYVFAYGGNPEAAELAGINTRLTILKVYILMGFLCGIAAAIAAARLNSATLDVGSGSELYVIAAAVIGGTSFAGGIGTITGAVLGALVMQSLAFGLSYVGLSSPVQNMVAGLVLIVAVGFDAWNRRRTA